MNGRFAPEAVDHKWGFGSGLRRFGSWAQNPLYLGMKGGQYALRAEIARCACSARGPTAPGAAVEKFPDSHSKIERLFFADNDYRRKCDVSDCSTGYHEGARDFSGAVCRRRAAV
jgi:hypothetical protein